MQRAKQIGLFGGLLLTWLILFFALTFLTELIMTPWDTAIHIPEVGTWQRTLNDFFGYQVGKFLFSVPLILLSIVLTIRTLRAHPDALAHFVGGNLLFLGVLYVLFLLAASINNEILFPYPPVMYDPNYRGFHRSVFPMIVIGTACIFWVIWQGRMTTNGKPLLLAPRQAQG